MLGLLLFEIAFGVIGAFGSTGLFSPADGAAVACALVALVQAASVAWGIEVSRRRHGGSIGGPRGVSSFGGVLFVGAVLFFLAWMVGAVMVCGPLNAIFGTRTLQTATIEAKTQDSGRGCHFNVYVFADSVASGTRLCVDEARWRGLAVGGHLPLSVVDGRLGQSVALGTDDPRGAR